MAFEDFLGGDKPARRRSRRSRSRSASSPTRKVDDGRFNNNGWLQECPDPITKISWDNAILISPRLAKELGIDPPANSA
jgi:hypothetical protein